MGQIGLVGQVEFVGNEEGGSQRWRRNRVRQREVNETVKSMYDT